MKLNSPLSTRAALTIAAIALVVLGAGVWWWTAAHRTIVSDLPTGSDAVNSSAANRARIMQALQNRGGHRPGKPMGALRGGMGGRVPQ